LTSAVYQGLQISDISASPISGSVIDMMLAVEIKAYSAVAPADTVANDVKYVLKPNCDGTIGRY
jgi:hypothetical protein